MADIFGTSSSSSKNNTGNDFFSGIDLTTSGNGGVIGNNTGGNIKLPNTSDLMSSLGAVKY